MARRLPSLNALKTFEAAARHLSFSIAADELCVTQAAVSRQIRLLEEDLGVTLFHRLTRAVELTEDGAMLFVPLRDSLDQIESATNRIWGNNGKGILTVSVLPTFAMKWLIPRLSRFSELHPDIEIHMVNSIRSVDFDRDGIDLAIRVGRTAFLKNTAERPRIELTMTRNWEGLEIENLMPDELIGIMSPQLPPLNSLEDIENYTILHMSTRPNAWPDFFKSIGINRPALDDGPSYGHFFMSIQAAAEGKGIALVPRVLVEEDLQLGTVVQAFPQTALSDGEYCLIGRKKNWKMKKIRVFRNWLRKELASGT